MRASAVPRLPVPYHKALGERERRQWLMLTVQLYCFAEA
jgi:hypothetical protein